MRDRASQLMLPSLPGLLLALLIAACALLASCEHRAPLSQAEALSSAESLQRADGLFWGSPMETLPPAGPDDAGHRWWQLRYADTASGPATDRMILVDAASGWARLPYPGYQVRVPAISSSGAPLQPVTVQDGPFVLLLTTPAVVGQEEAGRLDHEASRLNALAGANSLYPLFSVRTDDQQRTSLVYGWQGDRGIQRDTRISEWTSHHTTYGIGTWVDLRR